jgi:hypothetical protein
VGLHVVGELRLIEDVGGADGSEVVGQFGHRLDAAGDFAVVVTVLPPKCGKDEGCRETDGRSD